MVNLLDSMIAVIDPEMPRQISTWGGGTHDTCQFETCCGNKSRAKSN